MRMLMTRYPCFLPIPTLVMSTSIALASLQVIQDRNFTCPKDWRGFRELTSK